MGQYDALLKPLTIKNVTFRNRVFSSSHSPGYAKGGHITDRYLRYHEEKAKGIASFIIRMRRIRTTVY